MTILKTAKHVAFQGEPGAYANLAAREAIPHAVAVPKPSFEEAIEAARGGETDLVIIPVENSLIGRIADIHHLLPNSGLHIVGEHFLPIRHQLMGIKGAALADLKSVYSQTPALAQCRAVIRQHGLTAHHWYDTAGSAKHVSELKDKSAAAIASTLAAEFYGLEILKPDVQDAQHNATRFLIMARDAERPPNSGKIVTSLIFQVKNAPAALYKALGAFATNGVNMTRLESYQLGGSFNATQFYADIQGHPDAANVGHALEELRFQTARLTVMGVYPASPFREDIP